MQYHRVMIIALLLALFLKPESLIHQTHIANKSRSISAHQLNSETDAILSISERVLYSSYFGGNLMDESWIMKLHPQGYLIVAGYTYSENFPVTLQAISKKLKGWCDVFLMIWETAEKKLLYSTFIGGSMIDRPTAMDFDQQGNIYLTGYTYSIDFPVTGGAFQKKNQGKQDVFLMKLNPSATAILYSTLLGGTDNDFPSALIIDEQGNAYITGTTYSDNFPTSNTSFQRFIQGENDLFFVKMNPTGSHLLHGTYMGGSGADFSDAMLRSHDGSFFIAGTTHSRDFLQLSGRQLPESTLSGNAFLMMILPNRYQPELCFSIGGSRIDKVISLALDHENKIWLGGNTYSLDFPSNQMQSLSETALPAIFICSWDIRNRFLESTSIVSGNSKDFLRFMHIQNEESLFFAGTSFSDNLFPSHSSLQDTNQGQGDGFILQWNKNTKEVEFATYWGGSSFDEIRCLHVTDNNRIWMVGNTQSVDFPITSNAWRKTLQGTTNSFLSCILMTPKPLPPQLVSPPNEAFEVMIPTKFCWEDQSNVSFRLFLYDAGLNLIFESVLIQYASIELPFLLDFEQRYLWMVQSFNKDGLNSSSPLWSFRTEGKRTEVNYISYFSKSSYSIQEPIYLQVCLENSGNVTAENVRLILQHPAYVVFISNTDMTEDQLSPGQSEYLLRPMPYGSFSSYQLKAYILSEQWNHQNLIVKASIQANSFQGLPDTLDVQLHP